MKWTFLKGFVVMLAVVLAACGKMDDKRMLSDTIQAVRAEYAPDSRTALFDVTVVDSLGRLVLTGETNLPEAAEILKTKLDGEDIVFKDAIEILPSEGLEGKTQALINISVANLRSEPKHAAQLATQATLGTPVTVLKEKDGWYYIQTPDKYLAWVDGGGIERMDPTAMENWKSAPKVIYTNTYGHSYIGPDGEQPVSDLVAGNVLEIIKNGDQHYRVRYPDGRKAYVAHDESQPYEEWLEALTPNADSLVATSLGLMGAPYLWGGTSTKGMDCSGFTKTVYFLNGMVIPRDASQQVHTGKAIDSTQNFENLQKGDLLFFGRKATDSTSEKVVHVGMWIGNNEFIHSSEMVRISSMDENAHNYDPFNRDRYLRTKRVLNVKDEGVLRLVKDPLFKD
ncbi:MAG TPA: C40 family peptidase [Pricia sp.]|nr:C40 family peptidase [Pricia sp.]